LVMAVLVSGLMADAKPSDNTNNAPAAERRSIEDKKWIAKAPMDEVEKRSFDFEKKAMGQCRQPYVAFEEAMKKKYDAGVKAGEAMHELEKCMFD